MYFTSHCVVWCYFRARQLLRQEACVISGRSWGHLDYKMKRSNCSLSQVTGWVTFRHLRIKTWHQWEWRFVYIAYLTVLFVCEAQRYRWGQPTNLCWPGKMAVNKACVCVVCKLLLYCHVHFPSVTEHALTTKQPTFVCCKSVYCWVFVVIYTYIAALLWNTTAQFF